MSFLKSALDLASKGFHVFPVYAGSKLPAIVDFPKLATRDQMQIVKWWTDPVMGFERDFNIGISTSKFGEGDEALLVIDVDNKGKKKGSEVLLELELQGLELPRTLEQVTPTGGRHIFFRVKEPLRQGTNVLGPGLDTRSKGGYVVGAGSVIDHKEYVMLDGTIAASPEILIKRIGKAREKNVSTPAIAFDEGQAVVRAEEYLGNGVDHSIQGEGGNETAYKVACRVKDMGVSRAKCLDLLLGPWNEKCEPPWSAEELSTIVDNVYKYGTETPGSLSPQAQFAPVDPDPTPTCYLEEMNKSYAFILKDGGHKVVHETVNEDGSPTLFFINEASFRSYYDNQQVVRGDGKTLSRAAEWLKWPKRRTYKGICFAPEREAKHGYYNLWRGFTCEPISPEKATAEQKLGLDMFLEHALQNVCLGNQDHFNWIMGYFAQLIQDPCERPLTTLVFKGSKGVGKNSLVDRVGAILGQYYTVVHDGRYLTSNFNGHLASSLMLVLDEAFWSGNKQAEGVLKGLTTERKMRIERKGEESFSIDNLVRLVVIGNEDWLVPASTDERRYAVFQVGEGRKKDAKFFTKMRDILDHKGGKGLLLHYLKTFDLSKVDVNEAPLTDALAEQKIHSLDNEAQWWNTVLQEGEFPDMTEFDGGWPVEISKRQAHQSLERYCKGRNIRSRIKDTASLTKFLKRVCPSIDAEQRLKKTEGRPRCYRLPTLETARGEWEKTLNQKLTWD